MNNLFKDIQNEQLKAFIEYQEKLTLTMKPIENSIFLLTQLNDDSFYHEKKMKLTIMVLGNQEDQQFFKAQKEEKETKLTLPSKVAITYHTTLFQTTLECSLSKVDTEGHFLKVIKPGKLKFDFFARDFENRNIINTLAQSKQTNIFQYSFSDFKSMEDIHQNILIKSAQEIDLEKFSNWRLLGKTQASISQNVAEKDILLHQSLIPQISKFLTDSWLKENQTIDVKYLDAKIQQEYLKQNLPEGTPSKKVFKV